MKQSGRVILVLAWLMTLWSCAAPSPKPASALVEPIKGSVKLTDPPDSLIDRHGRPSAGENFLDIREADLSSAGMDYVFRLKVNGPLPRQTIDRNFFYQWDIFVDADGDAATGEHWPVMTNELGVEYFVRLYLSGSRYKSEVKAPQTKQRESARHRIFTDTLEIRWPARFFKSKQLRFVITTKKFVGNSLVLFDKLPKQLYVAFPTDPMPIRSGPPTATLETPHATIHYNRGDEKRARYIADGFELAYREIGREVGAYPPVRMTYFVYVTLDDYVKGLDRTLATSPSLRALFPGGAASIAAAAAEFAPVNHVQHVSPFMDWRGLLHEYVHMITVDAFGRRGEAWVIEGIANYLACRVLQRTKYREQALQKASSYLTTARQALEQGHWLSLPELGSMAKWDARFRQRSGGLAIQYAEAYAAFAYVAEKYGMDKLISLVKMNRSGRKANLAIEEVLGTTTTRLEKDIQLWLRPPVTSRRD